MPTYTYRCTECQHSFDVQQSFTEQALDTCPQCSGTLRKVFGNIGVTFKGAGFYRTNSRSKSSGSSSASGSSSTSSSGSSSSDSGSSAPAEKKAPAPAGATASTAAGG